MWLLSWIFWHILCMNVLARRSFIALRDRDFVGEDPVLAAELSRRLAQTGDLPGKLKGETGLRSYYSRPQSARSTPQPVNRDQPSLGKTPLPADGRRGSRRQFDGWAYWDLNEQLQNDQAVGKGDKGNFVAYKNDTNATNLYAMHLKIAEQTIYGLQHRIKQMDRIVEPHKDSRLMRMAYALKRMDIWMDEMLNFYGYSHKVFKERREWRNWWTEPQSHNNPWYFSNFRHIMYYQAILRRYIDVVYTVDYLRHTYAEEVKKSEERQDTLPFGMP